MLIAPVVVVVGLVLSAEGLEVTKEVDAPARGSVNGPWAMVEGSFLGAGQTAVAFSAPPAAIGSDLELVGGIGFELGGVRFSPTARFSLGPRVSINPTQFTMGWSALAFALATPDLINDTKFTGLRFTPIIGATFPTHPNAFVGGQVPVSVLRVAGQLERRFGTLEVAYRPTASTTQCQPIRSNAPGAPLIFPCLSTWNLSNRLFAENWFTKSLSAALGVSWSMQWIDLKGTLTSPGPCGAVIDCEALAILNGRKPTHSVAAQLLVSWAFSELFGGTLEFNVSHGPTVESLSRSVTAVAGSVSVWFRTDGQLQRNWLDR